MQEIKCVDEAFPAVAIEELGYNIAVHGQKTYNGVAILSKYKLDDIRKGLPGDDGDLQARYIEAVANLPGKALRIASVYVPNGQDAISDKFQYKLRFLDRLHEHIKMLLAYGEMLVIGGDYNIAPVDVDVHHPQAWHGSVLTHDDVRQRFRRICNLGMSDAFRTCNPTAEVYSWWDYRGNSFARNEGLRIDHLLLSPQSADKLKSSVIKTQMRASERASDHVPVVVELF